jgi:hypothetical protein
MRALVLGGLRREERKAASSAEVLLTESPAIPRPENKEPRMHGRSRPWSVCVAVSSHCDGPSSTTRLESITVELEGRQLRPMGAEIKGGPFLPLTQTRLSKRSLVNERRQGQAKRHKRPSILLCAFLLSHYLLHPSSQTKSISPSSPASLPPHLPIPQDITAPPILRKPPIVVSRCRH